MNVKLTPEQERIVKAELNAGRFHSVEQVIGKALQALREKQNASASEASGEAQKRAVDDMLAFIEKHRARLDGISVKELIHEGHRL